MPHYDNRRASISSSQYSSTSASSHGSLASIDEDKVLNSCDMDIVHHPTTTTTTTGNHPLNAPFHSNHASHHPLSSSLSSSCSSSSSMAASPDSDHYRNKEDLVQHLLHSAAAVNHSYLEQQSYSQQQQQSQKQHRKSIKRPRQRKKNHHHNNHTSMSSSNLTAAVGISRGIGLSTINPEIMQRLQLQVSIQKQEQQQRKPTPQTEEERQRILARMNNYNLSVAGAGAAAVPIYRDRDRAGFTPEEEKLQDKRGMSLDVILPFLQRDNSADVEEALPIVTDVLVCEASHNVSESLANNENDRYSNESDSDYNDDDVGDLVVVRESADKPWWTRKKFGSFQIALCAIVVICLGGFIGIVAHTSINKDNDNSSNERSDYQDILSDDEYVQYNNELNALFRLFRLGGGESWNDRRGWKDAEPGRFLPENHYCSWYGIKCSDDYFNITEIDLVGNNLAGTTEDMGESLTNLLSLKLLNLASNSIQGNIYGLNKYLLALKNLRIINLRDNQITGTVSGSFCETAIFVDCTVECECCDRRC